MSFKYFLKMLIFNKVLFNFHLLLYITNLVMFEFSSVKFYFVKVYKTFVPFTINHKLFNNLWIKFFSKNYNWIKFLDEIFQQKSKIYPNPKPGLKRLFYRNFIESKRIQNNNMTYFYIMLPRNNHFFWKILLLNLKASLSLPWGRGRLDLPRYVNNWSTGSRKKDVNPV